MRTDIIIILASVIAMAIACAAMAGLVAAHHLIPPDPSPFRAAASVVIAIVAVSIAGWNATLLARELRLPAPYDRINRD